MRVKVRGFASFREVMGREVLIELSDGSTMRDLLEALCSNHDGLREALFRPQGELREEVTLLRKGHGTDPSESMEIVLEDGDEVAILPPFSGG